MACPDNRSRLARGALALAAGLVLLAAAAAGAGASFVNFESGHVRPLALSPDGSRLFAVNTPDNRLEIFDVTGSGLAHVASVPVGLEPVAVAARSDTSVWVVNHLSDSISIVRIDDVDPTLSRVVRTLHVGDEPRDIVFGGPDGARAFVTTARRGQNAESIVPANPTTPGTARALVWVFDSANPGLPLGGTPLAVIQLFGDTPRALAVSPDGGTVYAAVFHSGNRTTAVPEPGVSLGLGLPPFPPGSTPGAPNTGLIVRFNGAQWVDELNRNWSALVPFSLPDRDVFLIDANASPPALVASPNSVVGVGTVLFNMAVRPSNGRLYVSNLSARNFERFESLFEHPAGTFRGVRGHTAENHITVIDGTTPTAHHLNPHVDYEAASGPQSERDQSTAFPLGMAFTPDGESLFVAAFGSGKVAVLDADDLEDADPEIADQPIEDVGLGPSGLALDAANDRLYVMNRIDHEIAIVSNATVPALRAVTSKVKVGFDPEPPEVRLGRRFLYDAKTTSGHGDQACASCHIFGDLDSLAWDLGDPFGESIENPNPFVVGAANDFHPLKGPMTTQSLRGMAGQGPMHWRGDRTGGNDPGGDALDEDAAFKKFNPAFVGLLGRSAQLPAADMQAFTNFVLTLAYPPNPIRALNDVATPEQAAGLAFFQTELVDLGVLKCVDCHALPTGAGGNSSFEGETQEFKIAHLRNAYQKIGMFPAPGDQIRGFGFLHDGSTPNVFEFLKAGVFNFDSDQQRRDLEALVLAFDTGLRPIVGQQVTLRPASYSNPTLTARITLMVDQCLLASACDLVVKGVVGGEARGYLLTDYVWFQPDRAGEPPIQGEVLRAEAATAGQELTYTAAPPGTGVRMALDRDGDGGYDRDELDAGFDPADPSDRGPCTDQQDNDGDGLVDLADPGCRNAQWSTESPSCNDGVDNDLDGAVDMADPNCGNPWSDNELAAADSCGLLGIETLPVLAWAAVRRRRKAVQPRT